MPATSDVGTNIRNLSKTKWPNPKQRVAIALSEARRHGANIPPPKFKLKIGFKEMQ